MSVTDWLLDSDPAIRWQVMQDLLDRPAEVVSAERNRVAKQGWGAQLLALQEPDGYWGGEEWDNERRSVYWTLHLLRWFGVDPRDPNVRAAIERTRDGVTWKYWENRPFFFGEVEPCINGGVLALGAYFGEVGAGSDRLVGLLLEEQLDDGGWNCEAPKSKRSSFDSTLCVLEGLLLYDQAVTGSNAAVTAARRRGEEYLLERGLFRRLTTGEVVLPRYRNFSFPPYWFYDVLRALDYFRSTGDPYDPRIADGVELVRSRRGEEGRWNAGVPWPGEGFFPVEAPEGQPSRWNTLRALRVLRWYDPASFSID